MWTLGCVYKVEHFYSVNRFLFRTGRSATFANDVVIRRDGRTSSWSDGMVVHWREIFYAILQMPGRALERWGLSPNDGSYLSILVWIQIIILSPQREEWDLIGSISHASSSWKAGDADTLPHCDLDEGELALRLQAERRRSLGAGAAKNQGWQHQSSSGVVVAASAVAGSMVTGSPFAASRKRAPGFWTMSMERSRVVMRQAP